MSKPSELKKRMAKFDALGKVTGRIQPNQINIQTNIVLTSYIDQDSGEVRWTAADKANG
jgi:hypothetical protein